VLPVIKLQILNKVRVIPRMAFLLSHLIPLCGLESAYARQRSSKLGAALAYSQISPFSFLLSHVPLIPSRPALPVLQEES
jgi:hypothetical protein